MADALARARPAYEPGTAVGYHALTFGWLVGELVRRISDTPIDHFLQKEIAEPLGLDGLYIGCPSEHRHRIAALKPMSAPSNRLGAAVGLAFNPVSRGLRAVRSPVNPHRMVNAVVARGMEDVLVDRSLLDAAIPAMNGHFDAVSLGGMYAMLAGGGQLGGVRILSTETVRKASDVQNDQRDRVVVIRCSGGLATIGRRYFTSSYPAPTATSDSAAPAAGPIPSTTWRWRRCATVVAGAPIGDLRILRLSQAAARAVHSG